MAILNIQIGQTGQDGQHPNWILIDTNNTLAEVLTAGFLNRAKQAGYAFSENQMALVSTKANPSASTIGLVMLQVSYTSPNWSLVSPVGTATITLPTIANHIATYTNTSGGLSEDPATAISSGNVQAGLSGTAGYLASFPGTAARGSLRFVAANSAGNTVTQVTNASQAAARVFTIPDGGQSASNFIISDNASTQTISTGNLSVAAGNVSAGSSGSAGTLSSFPATAANGSLIISALNAGGAFTTTIRNSAMGQSTVYSLADIGAATGGIPVSTAPIKMKSVQGAAAAGGAAAQSFTDAFCTSGSNVIGNWVTQANAASVLTIVPGNGSFVVTSTADAGVGTFSYVIMK